MKLFKVLVLWLWCYCAIGATVSYQTTNGMLLQPTNFFPLHVLAGTNVQITYNTPTNTITISVTNIGSGGSALSFNGVTVTNANISDTHAIKWAGSGTNYQAYITNYFYWEGIPIWGPTIRDGVYVAWSQSGTNLTPFIPAESLDPTRWEHLNWPTLMGRYSASIGDIEYITVGANLNLDSGTGILSATIPPGTNSYQIGVDGTLVVTPNLVDSSELNPTATDTNISYAIVPESIDTNKVNTTFQNLLLNQYRINNLTNWFLSITNNVTDTGRVMWRTNANGDWEGYATNLPAGGGGGSGTNAFVNGVLMQPFRLTNNESSDVGRVIWYTNSNGDALAYATNLPAGGGSGAGTNAFVNGVLQQPIRLTNSTDTAWSDDGSGNWGVIIDTNRFYALLTNSLVGSNNVSIAYDGGALKVMISAVASGGTGTAVTVDGGSDLTRLNLADASTTFLFDLTTTNATGRLPDRDFGDITVGSSGASMAINANSVALGTDTTGNYVATVAGTANKVDVSGSGSETAAVTVTLSDTIDIGGNTSFEIPNSAAPTTDAFGEIAGDNNAWASGRGALQFFDGTANTWLVGVVSSDTPSNGQVPKWNTGGTITWEDDGGGAGGGGTNILVNGTLVNGANLTNSSTVLWSVSGTNITAVVTNVAGATTQNVVQKIGGTLFRIGGSPGYTLGNDSYTGIVTNVVKNAGDSGVPLEVTLSFSSAPSTNYVVTMEPYDENGSHPSASAFSVADKTTSGVRVISEWAGATVGGVWYRIWILDTISVAGSGGDVISTNNNEFTATNTFSGSIVFGGDSRTNWPDAWNDWDDWETRTWTFVGTTSTTAFEPNLGFTALSSGTSSALSGLAVFDGRGSVSIRTATGTATSTGGFIHDGNTTLFLGEREAQLKADFSLNRTNGAVYRIGFGDSTSTTEPTDTVSITFTNDIACGVLISNAIKAVTSTLALQQGVSYRAIILQTNDWARFILQSNVAGASSVTLLDEGISGVPLGSSRTLSVQFGGWNTNTANTNGIDLLTVDSMAMRKRKRK